MNQRWALSIDIEGFSAHYEHSEEGKTYAICGLGELMGAIHRIGCQCYPGSLEDNFSKRLFAHQYGDGFLVCSDYPETDISRAIAIAVTLMRHMTVRGYATKAALSTGELSDIRGCYPKPMSDANGDRIDMGMGLMTTISVMGTALTKAHKLGVKHRGAVLVVDRELIGSGMSTFATPLNATSSRIDWISCVLPLADEIALQARLGTADAASLCRSLKSYCGRQPLPPDTWIKSTFEAVTSDA